MDDEQIIIEINEILKERFDGSPMQINMWWLETSLDAFAGRLPVDIIDEGYGTDLLEYARKNYVN